VRLIWALTATAISLVAAPVVAVPPVSADCAAPTVKFKPARVARGSVLTITGQYFGDDCLDTGTLPPGLGPLGTPLAGLVIVIDQGSNEFVVATGSADSDYEFSVDIVVPVELEPGEAVLNVLGSGDARLTIDPPLVITSVSPDSTTESTVATFGPPTTDVEPVGSLPPVILPAEIPDDPIATTPSLSTTPVDDVDDHAALQRRISVGFAGVVAIAAIGFAFWSRSKRRSRRW
jgi:hypothetical protein